MLNYNLLMANISLLTDTVKQTGSVCENTAKNKRVNHELQYAQKYPTNGQADGSFTDGQDHHWTLTWELTLYLRASNTVFICVCVKFLKPSENEIGVKDFKVPVITTVLEAGCVDFTDFTLQRSVSVCRTQSKLNGNIKGYF